MKAMEMTRNEVRNFVQEHVLNIEAYPNYGCAVLEDGTVIIYGIPLDPSAWVPLMGEGEDRELEALDFEIFKGGDFDPLQDADWH